VNQQDPLANRNYRIRRLRVTVMLDVYDDAGVLIDGAESDQPFLITEANISRELATLIVNRTGLTRGFTSLYPDLLTPPAPPPLP